MTKRHRKTCNSAAQAIDDGWRGDAAFAAPAPSEDERQMAECCITQDGLRYRYNGYRYDRLADALAYARLMRSRPTQQDVGGPFTHAGVPSAPPTDDECDLMAALGIRFLEGTYRFADFRYERLVDAVTYAGLSLRRKPER
jgi:hypothetical protein